MRFETAQSIENAIDLVSQEKGQIKFLAGGTDVIVQINSGMPSPDLIIDIKHIPSIREIRLEDGGFRIGAGVPCARLSDNAALVKAWPGVVEGAQLIGSTQVQNRATIVGNLCNASPAGDSVPALVAAGATARICGPNGTREIPVQEVPVGPGKTSLQRGELIDSIFIPNRPSKAADAYLRFIPRTEMDIAVVGAAVNITLDDAGVITDARVSLGAVSARVLLVEDCAKAILGTKLDETALNALASAASAACNPIDDKRGTKEFRIKVAGTLAKRAALIAYKRAGDNQ